MKEISLLEKRTLAREIFVENGSRLSSTARRVVDIIAHRLNISYREATGLYKWVIINTLRETINPILEEETKRQEKSGK